MLIPVLVALTLGVAGESLPDPADACGRDALEGAATRAKAIRTRLLGAAAADSNVSPATGRDLQALKDAFTDLADAALRCTRGEDFDDAAFERSLLERLSVDAPAQPEASPRGADARASRGVYGADLQVAIGRPKAVPHVLTVALQFGIACGVDSVLLVYEWQHGEWQRALRWQSPPYEEISGAFGDFFQYVLLPGERRREEWVLAVAHGTPWCTSRWSMFHADVVERAEGDRGRVLFHMEDGYTRDADVALKPTADGFELRLQKGSVDNLLMTRPGLFRYRIAGGQVTRVQPVAMNGRDFVDEWLQASWSESERWSWAAHRGELQRLHAGLSLGREHASVNFGAVRGCSDDAFHFQVELRIESSPPSATYFQIHQEKNGFTMLTASASADPRCHGADLMRER